MGVPQFAATAVYISLAVQSAPDVPVGPPEFHTRSNEPLRSTCGDTPVSPKVTQSSVNDHEPAADDYWLATMVTATNVATAMKPLLNLDMRYPPLGQKN